MEETKNLKDFTNEEFIAFIKKEREIYTIEECENIEQLLCDRVRKTLDFRDLMKLAKANYKKSKRIINKYMKNMKKEKDVKRLLKNHENELNAIESRYVASMVDLMMIVIKVLGSELLSNKLVSLEKWYEFEPEDLIFVNGIIKALKYNDSFDISLDDIIEALDFAIDEYVTCIEKDEVYRDKFDKSFMYVCFPEKEEQEDKDE